MELMEGGALTDLVLRRQGNFSEEFVRWSLYQVALGLQAMHAKNVLHRDLKSDNILVRPTGEVKIADMGFSVFLSDMKQYRDSQKGTPSWVSPEIAQGHKYSKEVDVWAYGCFAFELLATDPPFHSFFARGMDALLDAIILEPVPRIPAKWSDRMNDFVQKCLIKSPTERWSID